MTIIITPSYERYGGDSYNILYLNTGSRGVDWVQLCLEVGNSASHKHLTSDPEYAKWLFKHAQSLLLIAEDKWYGSSNYKSSDVLYREFRHCLETIMQPIRD